MPVSLGSILSNARSALSSAQTAIGVTSDNIANATTPGYSRKRAELTPAHPLTMPDGQFGTGVRIADVSRLRDALLDGSFRDASAEDAASRARAQALGQLESLFGEPSETGLGATLDAFYNAWSDLAGNPTNASARLVIRERGHQVAARFQQLAAGMQRLASDAEVRLRTDVDRVNDLARRIGELNVDIVAAESGGRSAGALRDERDRLIDELSTLGPIEVIPRGTSSVAVAFGSTTIVDGATVNTVEVTASAGSFAIRTSRGALVELGGRGTIGAGLAILNEDLPAARNALDTLAREIARTVNDAHATGMGPAGVQGVLFFDVPVDPADPASLDYTQVTAASLALSSAIAADADMIAAGTPADVSGVPSWAPGANDVALAIAGLRDIRLPGDLGDRTPGEFYDSLVTHIGLEKRAADDDGAVHQALRAQAETRRDAVSGVSIDEELVNLIRFQNAYTAASRVISTVDEMMQSLLGMKR